MAPKYKLTYFDLGGLGEPIRYLLSYGGLDFEDNRISREKWPSLKPSIGFPLKKMPVLEFDGNTLFQSMAICRYLANELGLLGATPLENWEIDAVVDTVTELRMKVAGWFWEQDEAKKETLKEALEKEHIPFYLSKLEEWAKRNNGYLAAGKLTWADVIFIGNAHTMNEFISQKHDLPLLFTGYPTLEALQTKITNSPGIKAWLAKRPPSHF